MSGVSWVMPASLLGCWSIGGGGLAGEVLEQFGKLIVSCDVFGGNIMLAVLITEKLALQG